MKRGSGPVESSPAGSEASSWSKLRRGLSRTQTQLVGRLKVALAGRTTVDRNTIEALEEALIGADIGVETSMELLDRIRLDLRRGVEDLVQLRTRLADEIAVMLMDAPQPPPETSGQRWTLVTGVNGAGKTTCIAKLAWRLRGRGRSVLLAAADTFRAAAIDQLVVWGRRLDIPVVRQQPGADPAAVVFDALQAARARGIDDVIVDTAGRMHTKRTLMDELSKIGRVAAREGGERQGQTLLVVDATTGQNAVRQAQQFSAAVDLDGIFLTKLDGTAKGGIVVALAIGLRLPVLYLGVGEGAEDIVSFNAREFVRALLE